MDEALLIQRVSERVAAMLQAQGLAAPSSATGSGETKDDEKDALGGIAPSILRSVVKIYATSSAPSFILPWQRKQQSAVSGSGFVLDRRRRLVVTNSHVVEHATFVELRKHGDAARQVGSVIFIAPECDLALIHVPDDSFWDDASLIELPVFKSVAGQSEATAAVAEDGGAAASSGASSSAAASPSSSSVLVGVHQVAAVDLFDSLPDLQQGVKVVGYPLGGDQLSITSGVVSRIDLSAYENNPATLMSIQIDAAINSGNSGGPALSADGKLIGIAFQVLLHADGIGYIIPIPVLGVFLRAFLRSKALQLLSGPLSNTALPPPPAAVPAAAAAAGEAELPPVPAAGLTRLDREYFPGFPQLRIFFQQLTSDYLRAHYKMQKHHTGVLVAGLSPQSPFKDILMPDDVILKVNGFHVANDATVEFRPRERIYFTYLVFMSRTGVADAAVPSGEDATAAAAAAPSSGVALTILRAGVEQTVVGHPVIPRPLVPYHLFTPEFRERPKYYTFGGLIVSTLSFNLLTEWGDQWYNTAPRWLVAEAYRPVPDPALKDILVIVQVLSHELNKGYDFAYATIITHVNGVKVLSFEQFVAQMELAKKQDESVALDAKSMTPFKIVLPTKRAQLVDAEHVASYGIPPMSV